MAKQFEVKTRLTAEDETSPVVASLSSRIAKLGTAIGAGLVAAVGLAVTALAALQQVMEKAIEQAFEQEESVTKLAFALEKLGPAGRGAQAALLAQADALQKTTRFTDDAIISAQALLATYNVGADRLAQATQVTVDLAAALGTDLNTAATRVGASFSGMTRGLEKIVPGIKDFSDASLAAGEHLDLFSEKLGGAAVKAADTYAGALDRVRKAHDELLEAMGTGVIESEELREAHERLALNLHGLSFEVKDAGGLWAKLSTFMTAWKANLVGNATHLLGLTGLMISGKKATDDYAKSMKDLAEAAKGAADEMDRNTRVYAAVAAGQSEAAKIAKELGVTLESELEAKAERQRLLWERLNELLRLTGDRVIPEVKGAIEDLGNSLGVAGDAAEAFRGRLANLETQANSTTRAVMTQAQAWEYLARTQGRAVATEAAVAAGGRTILGGTRVLLPGGGSRLTSEPGFGKFGG